MGKKIIEAVSRVQAMRDEAAKASDEYEKEGLDADGSWKSWEAESIGSAHEGGIDALDRVLDVLQSLAHGITPAQGEALGACEECETATVDTEFKGADGRSVCDDCRDGEPKLDEEAQEALVQRKTKGEVIMGLAWGADELHEDDRLSAAKDAISNVLTAIYGPAGLCLPPTGIFDNVSDVIADARGEQVWRVKIDQDTYDRAVKLLSHALGSWEGDAEDYTVEEG